MEEASYPYKHFTNQLTPEVLDEALRGLDMVERYASELLKKAGYKDEEVERITSALIHEATLHEEVVRYDKAKEFGLRVRYYRESSEYKEAWEIMREWLKKYYHRPSRIHIIRHTLPR